MYTIYADGKPLYSPLLVNEGYGVISPKITRELNKVGSLEFTLPESNKKYNELRKLTSIITVFQDDNEIFRSRVLNDTKDYYNRKKVYCEGELAFLLDSLIRPYEFTGGVKKCFTQYVDNHNSMVEEDKQFQVGMVTVTDPNDYITRSNIECVKTWNEINDKLINKLGGYIRSRLADGVRYVDYVADYDSICEQTIEFGKNLLDITEYITAENVFTCLIPYGAKLKDEEGNDTDVRLDIKSVNNGLDYIEDETGIALFGRIWKTETWDDVTVADNLLTKSKEALKKGIEAAVTLTLKAVDLKILGLSPDSIKLGDKVRVISPPHGIDAYFLCSKTVIDLVDLDKSEYILGVTYDSLTSKQVKGTGKQAVTIKDLITAEKEKIVKLEKDVADLKYKAIEISSFSNNKNTAEMGSTVNEVTLSWVLNKTPEKLTIDGVEQAADITSLALTGLGIIGTKTWKLEVTDERGATATKTTSISFLNGAYYGISSIPDAYDSDFILSLTKTLTSTRARSFTVNPGENEYIYYCVPTRFGDCTFYMGGFEGGITKVATFDFTNASGYTESYDVYRSDNPKLGQTTVTVS